MPPPEPASRPYRSARRVQQARQTRAAVLDAARQMFTERGWAATSVRDVAAAAKVSVETVYGAVGPKAALFDAVYGAAVVGDDEPVPLVERPEFQRVGQGSTLADRAAAAAELITDIAQRSIGLFLTLREGAASDPLLAERLAADDASRRIDGERGLALVLRRPVSREEVDVFWALSGPEIYDALVNRSGWTTAAYRTWITQLIIGMRTQEPA